ncbi:MAG: hypothetical protein ACR2FM_02620 [Candidatus Saccharimonadales bacterium]
MSRLLNSQEALEFKNLIDDYSLHEDGLKQFQDSNFGIIAGPAGAGKDTLRNSLTEHYPELYVPLLSTTTRPPRTGEHNGETYYFREIEEVRSGLEQREFFQAELVHNQQVSGLHLDEIRTLAFGQTGLSILVIEAERKIRVIKPSVKTVFLIPPDVATLTARMQSERMLDDAEINRRLDAARTEIGYALETQDYYCLVSDTIENVLSAAHGFFQNSERSEALNATARAVMRQILDTLNDW